ncbi:MAG: hypothetical protein U9N40_08570 [Euryarchaeota archaeon]|nr:hypothetical protein [Euryarchaeota archaeon]
MKYMDILTGHNKPMSMYPEIIRCLEDIKVLPFFIEPIYISALDLEGNEADHLHFALVRLQVFADIHRYEDVEEMQKMKYVAQVLEKIIFGSLMLEQNEISVD